MYALLVRKFKRRAARLRENLLLLYLAHHAQRRDVFLRCLGNTAQERDVVINHPSNNRGVKQIRVVNHPAAYVFPVEVAPIVNDSNPKLPLGRYRHVERVVTAFNDVNVAHFEVALPIIYAVHRIVFEGQHSVE